MKCRGCKKIIEWEEIYTDFYFCIHCFKTYSLGNWAARGLKK